MPHITVEYSTNLDAPLDMAGLCRALRDAAVETGVFPVAGIRVRAFAAMHVVIADGDPGHGFVDISVRMAEGRTAAIKAQVADAFFAVAREFTAQVMEKTPFLLSLELCEMDGAYARKASSIRSYLPPELH